MQAAQQAQCIHDALVKLVPSAAKEFDANWHQLDADLAALDQRLFRSRSAPRRCLLRIPSITISPAATA